MIEIMITYKELGYVYTHAKSNKVIFGELCNIRHLYDVLTLIKGDNDIVLYVDTENSIERVTGELRDLNIYISKSIINEHLDVSKELLHRVLLLTNKPNFDYNTRKVNTSCFLIGVLLSVCVSVYPTLNFFNSRLALVNSQNEVIKKIESSADDKIQVKSIYQEIKFLYNVNDIKLFEVKDKKLNVIFTCSKSGMKTLLMKSVMNATLTENVVKSDNSELIYYYTLTGDIL